jgi:hypothetical protein
MNMFSTEVKTALVIGHPGHELRVFHWLETMKPMVCVITDGSGRSGRSRLPSTTKILNQVNASQGVFYGSCSDREAYLAILNREFELFVSLARELAVCLIDKQVDYVAGDALEGYNPTHDVCRLIIDAGVEIARRYTNRGIGNFQFPLTGPPDNGAEGNDGGHIELHLDDAAFARKLSAARSYAELDAEVEAAISENRLEAFQVECLRPASTREVSFGDHDKPYYERYGEQQVAAGHYRDVIRYRDHFLPLAEALRQQVDKGI